MTLPKKAVSSPPPDQPATRNSSSSRSSASSDDSNSSAGKDTKEAVVLPTKEAESTAVGGTTDPVAGASGAAAEPPSDVSDVSDVSDSSASNLPANTTPTTPTTPNPVSKSHATNPNPTATHRAPSRTRGVTRKKSRRKWVKKHPPRGEPRHHRHHHHHHHPHHRSTDDGEPRAAAATRKSVVSRSSSATATTSVSARKHPNPPVATHPSPATATATATATTHPSDARTTSTANLLQLRREELLDIFNKLIHTPTAERRKDAVKVFKVIHFRHGGLKETDISPNHLRKLLRYALERELPTADTPHTVLAVLQTMHARTASPMQVDMLLHSGGVFGGSIESIPYAIAKSNRSVKTKLMWLQGLVGDRAVGSAFDLNRPVGSGGNLVVNSYAKLNIRDIRWYRYLLQTLKLAVNTTYHGKTIKDYVAKVILVGEEADLPHTHTPNHAAHEGKKDTPAAAKAAAVQLLELVTTCGGKTRIELGH